MTVDSLFQDIRHAIRMCLRTPGVTAVAILALALGIGANTAIFTIVNAVLIETLPFRDASRVVAVWETNPKRDHRSNVVAPANFLRWRDRADAFEQMSAFYDITVNLTGSGQPQVLVAQAVTPNFFSTLGVAPLLGRTFAPDEGPRGHDDFVILGYGIWQRSFGADPSIVGRSIQLSGRPTSVVGVMSPDTQLFLQNGTLTNKPPDIWLPFAFTEADRQPHGRYMSAIARLRPGVTVAAAQTQMSGIAETLTREWPQFDTGWGVRIVPLRRELSGELRPALFLLAGAVLFVLLIACANVANLLLARGAAREGEIAIRTALGAPRLRLVRQLLTESLVLAVAGGSAGILIARWGLDFLLAIRPVDLTGLGHMRVSYPVLAFTAVVSIATAAVAGLVPAFEGSRVDALESLKSGGRQVGTGVRRRRLRHAFVISEVALAVVLLVGAGLLIRSFGAMRGVDPGFDARNVLTLRVAVPVSKYRDDAQRVRFFREAIDRIRALAGVQSAGEISALPFAGLGAATGVTIDGEPPPAPGQTRVVDVRVCDNGYFATMDIPLQRGRLFTEREMREASRVVVINQTFAQRYFPGQDPLGKRVFIQMMDPVIPTEIVGVVGDVKHSDVTTPARPMSYWPHPILAYSAMTLTVKSAVDPLALQPAVERAIQSLDPDQPVSDVRTMDRWIAKSLAQARFSSLVLGVFAAVALLLASVGIYGVMSHSVSQRTSEIGIRLALGAGKLDILRMIVGNGIRLAAGGLAIGVALALALSRTVASLLYETSGADPITFAAVVVVLGAVAVLASYLPARRAAQITPVEALRYQ